MSFIYENSFMYTINDFVYWLNLRNKYINEKLPQKKQTNI